LTRTAEAMSDRAQFYALLALIVYTPLPLASNRPWALALLGMLSGSLLLWTIWKPCRRSTAIVWKIGRVPLFVQGLWVSLLALQLLPLPTAWLNAPGLRGVSGYAGKMISIDVYSTQLYLSKALILLIVFWVTLSLINSQRRIELLAKVIVISGLFQAMLGVMLMASGTTFEVFFVPVIDGWAHGTFIYHNHLAGYLEMTLATGIGLMIAKLDGRSFTSWRTRLHGWLSLLFSEKILLRVSLIIMVIGLVATRSRMGNSAFLASLLIVGLFTVILTKYMTRNISVKHKHDVTQAMMIFIVSLIVIDVVIIGGIVGIEKVVQRIENTNIETQARISRTEVGAPAVQIPSESLEQRSQAARYAVQIVRDYPLLGLGGGTFHLAFPRYVKADVNGFYDHAHNDYVEIASETGLTGLLLLGVIIVHSIMRAIALLAQSRDQLQRGMAFASLMGMVSLLIHAAVDFNFQNPANAMLFLIMISFPYLLNKYRI